MYGVGGWPGVGLVFDLQDPTAGLGAVGAFKKLANYTQMGGGVRCSRSMARTPTTTSAWVSTSRRANPLS